MIYIKIPERVEIVFENTPRDNNFLENLAMFLHKPTINELTYEEKQSWGRLLMEGEQQMAFAEEMIKNFEAAEIL